MRPRHLRDVVGITFSLVTNSKTHIGVLLALLGFFGADSVFFKSLPWLVRGMLVLAVVFAYLAVGYVQWRHSTTATSPAAPGQGTDFFRYLRPFDEHSKSAFLGREEKIVEAAHLMQATGFHSGIMVGESGSGKTSLIRAGLIPYLTERGVNVVYVNLVESPKPGRTRLVPDPQKPKDKTAPPTHTFFIFDQTEVWFTQARSDEGALDKLKADMRREASHIKVLMVVRKEFFIDLLRLFEPTLPELGHPNNRIDVSPFDRATAERILCSVAEKSHFHFEQAFLDAMLTDLDAGGILPAELQIVCSTLHERHQECTVALYRELGGKDGIIKHFLEERVLLRFPDHLVPDVKRILLSLIRDNERRALDAASIHRETGVRMEEVLYVTEVLKRDGVLLSKDGSYRLVHAYFIPPILRWSGNFRGTAQHARVLLKERLHIWRADHRTTIPPADLQVIRRHWSSTELEDLRSESEPLYRASRRSWRIKKGLMAALGVALATTLTYLSYPLLHYQMLAQAKTGRLLVEATPAVSSVELFAIDPATGELRAVPLRANREMELPRGDYYLRARMSGSPVVYERYPLKVETVRYVNDVKRVTLSEALFTRTSLGNMVQVPGGWFTMGDDAGRDDEKPAHQVKLSPFYIDKFEVSNKEYREFLLHMDRTKDHSLCSDEEPEGKDHHPTPWYGRQPSDYFTNPHYDNHPVTNVDWFDAYAYAAWRGKRLPTEAEWERAAKGTSGRRYPWGDQGWEQAGRHRANFFPDGGRPGDDGYEFTARVDAFPDGTTPDGIFNLAGNVYEFCYDWYHGQFYQHSPMENPIGPGVQAEGKAVRGGSLEQGGDDLRAANRQISPSRWTNNWVGFRCVVTAAGPSQ